MRPVLALLVLCLIALPALALPAPMSDAELMDKSDIVALVRVMSVTCTSVTKDKATGEKLPGYIAKLRIVKVKKGDVKPDGEVLVTFRTVPTGALGPWTVFYYPGEEVWTHLVKRASGAIYASTWWNAKGDEVERPETKDLPTVVGESAMSTETD